MCFTCFRNGLLVMLEHNFKITIINTQLGLTNQGNIKKNHDFILQDRRVTIRQIVESYGYDIITPELNMKKLSGFELVDLSLCSLDLASSDYHLFQHVIVNISGYQTLILLLKSYIA